MKRKILIVGVVVFAVVLLTGCMQKTTTTTTTAVTSSTIPPTTTLPSLEVEVESICTDGLDNDGDGLADSEDGDCWIREGVIYEVHPYSVDGTFEGITQKVPELKELGVKTIYLMPIWEHDWDKYHPYGIVDYYNLNPEHGNEADLHRLVDTIHANDMKILFDLVIAIASEEGVIYQEHPEWFLHDPETGEILNEFPHGWGPALDRTNPEVIDYFTGVIRYYVEEYDIDGWRVDAPANNYDVRRFPEDHRSTKLLRGMKVGITSVKPNAILYVENFGPFYELGPNDEFWPDYLDGTPVFDEMSESAYGWVFHGYVNYNMLRDSSYVSQDLVDLLNNQEIWHNRIRSQSLEIHDTIFEFLRLQKVYRLQGLLERQGKAGFNKPLAVMLSTIPGVPMIYSGQEVGDKYRTATVDPVDWARGDYGLRDFYKKVFEIRNNNNALKYGTISNVWESGDNTYAYVREYEDEKVIIVINFLDKEATSTLDLSFLPEETILYDELNEESFTVTQLENFEISVPAYGSRILVVR